MMSGVNDRGDGPVVKTPSFQCRKHSSIPGRETKILHVLCSQKISKMQLINFTTTLKAPPRKRHLSWAF